MVAKPKLEIPKLVEELITGWPPKAGGIINRKDPVTNPWEFSQSVIDRNENFKRLAADQGTFNFGTSRFTSSGKLPEDLKVIIDQTNLKI